MGTGKWIELTETACSQPTISAYMTQLTGKARAPFERALNFGLESTLRFYL
jgi:hypothetical protein